MGLTNNLEKRIKDHNSGKNTSTKSRKPFKLIYKEIITDRVDARSREKFLKSGSGREWFIDYLNRKNMPS